MRKLLFIIAICSLSSCGIFRKSSKDKLLTSSQSSIESTVRSSESVTDKSKITIKEKADTSVTTNQQTVSGSVRIGLNMDSLVNGLTAISNDLVDVKMVLDSNGILTTTAIVKPQHIPFQFDRTTTIEKDVTKSGATEQAGKSTLKQSSTAVKKESEPTLIGLWAWLGMGAIAGIVLYVVIKK
ncbi:hypothetical protein [Pedobacter agri]|uniref:Uncharacterized protein n=1 Tax=Pedobacter agri TaxID=454586 RepID=A0A9X3DI16_9SPHI|nr:hypothetical protein [Pedobacter agri]MCX3266526.1 hypothetical protein [Pedobacter agri]